MDHGKVRVRGRERGRVRTREAQPGIPTSPAARGHVTRSTLHASRHHDPRLTSHEPRGRARERFTATWTTEKFACAGASAGACGRGRRNPGFRPRPRHGVTSHAPRSTLHVTTIHVLPPTSHVNVHVNVSRFHGPRESSRARARARARADAGGATRDSDLARGTGSRHTLHASRHHDPRLTSHETRGRARERFTIPRSTEKFACAWP